MCKSCRERAAGAPHSLLAAIAAQTGRVKVGVACSIVPWYHPLRLAQDLATLDIISAGRLQIGVGRGYQKQEFDAYGMDIKDRQARHVTHFLCYMDLGGLAYEDMAPAMRLFAEQLIPHFT